MYNYTLNIAIVVACFIVLCFVIGTGRSMWNESEQLMNQPSIRRITYDVVQDRNVYYLWEVSICAVSCQECHK